MAVYRLLRDGGNTMATMSDGPAVHSREYAMMTPLRWCSGTGVQVNGIMPLVGSKPATKLPGDPLGTVCVCVWGVGLGCVCVCVCVCGVWG